MAQRPIAVLMHVKPRPARLRSHARWRGSAGRRAPHQPQGQRLFRPQRHVQGGGLGCFVHAGMVPVGGRADFNEKNGSVAFYESASSY